MKKINIKNKKKGIIFWVTGVSGVGKTTISKNLLEIANKKFGPTILINGDDFRKIFDFKKYDLKSRKKYVFQYAKFCKLISNSGINVIMAVVGLFHEIHKWNRKNFENYYEIYIKSDLKKIKIHDKRKIYLKNKVIGLDIKAELPKKPHITIYNDFKKNQKFYANLIYKKIKK